MDCTNNLQRTRPSDGANQTSEPVHTREPQKKRQNKEAKQRKSMLSESLCKKRHSKYSNAEDIKYLLRLQRDLLYNLNVCCR